MGTATNSLSVMARETKHFDGSELAGRTRFFATLTSATGCQGAKKGPLYHAGISSKSAGARPDALALRVRRHRLR